MAVSTFLGLMFTLIIGALFNACPFYRRPFECALFNGPLLKIPWIRQWIMSYFVCAQQLKG